MDVIKEEHKYDDELYSEYTIKNEEGVVADTFPVVRTGAKVSNMNYAFWWRKNITLHYILHHQFCCYKCLLYRKVTWYHYLHVQCFRKLKYEV
jgi:hypothetical protein